MMNLGLILIILLTQNTFAGGKKSLKKDELSEAKVIIKLLDNPENLSPKVKNSCDLFVEENSSCLDITDVSQERERLVDQRFKLRKQRSKIFDTLPLNERFLPNKKFDSLDKKLNQTQEDIKNLDNKLKVLVDSCSNVRFKACYPNLRNSLDQGEIENLYNAFTQDNRLRHNTGGGACHVRADALAYILAEKGIKANIVRIHQAPTLIAIDLNKDNSPTNRYYDYSGYHTLVQVMVKNKNGNVEPYLLDPQFMGKPLPREEYFRKTIGQDCQEVKNDDYNLNPLDCSYSLMSQNSSQKSSNDLLQNTNLAKCGWSQSQDGSGFAKVKKSPIKDFDKITLMNPNKYSKELSIKSKNKSLSNSLIIQSYKNYDTVLRKKISELNHYRYDDLKEKESDKKRLEKAIHDLPDKIKEIERNLKLK